jgi:hypothetical protein
LRKKNKKESLLEKENKIKIRENEILNYKQKLVKFEQQQQDFKMKLLKLKKTNIENRNPYDVLDEVIFRKKNKPFLLN